MGTNERERGLHTESKSRNQCLLKTGRSGLLGRMSCTMSFPLCTLYSSSAPIGVRRAEHRVPEQATCVCRWPVVARVDCQVNIPEKFFSLVAYSVPVPSLWWALGPSTPLFPGPYRAELNRQTRRRMTVVRTWPHAEKNLQCKASTYGEMCSLLLSAFSKLLLPLQELLLFPDGKRRPARKMEQREKYS